jgi:arylsulfatase A-like enzyme
MSAAWDAPLEFRNAQADEEDPPPPPFVDPPDRTLARDYDPDELLGIEQAYAGQVQLVDACLGLLMAALDESPSRDEALLAVTSPRGYPLGEHLRVGPSDGALYGELLHVPLLLRLPADEREAARLQQLVQPCDLAPTIAVLCGWGDWPADGYGRNLLSSKGPADQQREAIVAIGPGQRAIRTRAWFLRESAARNEPVYELFAKPDDRWEVNEVSNRGGEVASLLAAELDRLERALTTGNLAEIPPLTDVLNDIWR